MTTDPAAALPTTGDGTVELLWIPLGAGASVVRFSGRLFERCCATLARRAPCDLFHSALVVSVDGQRFTIEMAPVAAAPGEQRGVVAEGAVGSRWLRRLRVFRYEVRCWAGGIIPDAPAAVPGPVPIALDAVTARLIVGLASSVPTPVWGRDELRCGEMWNSNSVTSWLLASAGVDVLSIALPAGGRAPGWDAGRVASGRRVLAA